MSRDFPSQQTNETLPALVQTTCAYCGVGCGIEVKTENGMATSLDGMAEHPANFGRLCVKGTHLLETTALEGRLLQPYINNQAVDWDSAIDHVATEFQQVINRWGPDAVAFYVSGQFLTEDYYVANKLMKGYIGSANIDTNSRLCMSSAVAAYKRAFGEDVVPCNYSDLEVTELAVLVGSNAAWTHPVLFQRLSKAKQLNPELKMVVIDPRKTATAAVADLHLAIRPGTDAALFNGLLNFIAESNALDETFIALHTEGFEQTLSANKRWTVAEVANWCDIAVDDVLSFYQLFIGSSSALTLYSMGINQSSSGVDKCNAIINVHLASGKILTPGSGPFSLTGQPNAMGGREVGGLANQLAAHLEIENPEHRQRVQDFWKSPTIANKPGKMAVDLFEEVANGKIKAIWIMATNPLVSMPDRSKIAAALQACPLVIVSDCVSANDTLEYANVRLPATTWIEKDGTVTNSERRISRQRQVNSPAGQSRHDWQIISAVAQAMGYSGFDYTTPAQIFDEWVRMTGKVNEGERQLDLSFLSGMTFNEYQQLKPVQWPKGTERGQVFAEGKFSTPSGRARFIVVVPQLPLQCTNEAFPFVFNSGRVRDQWHTMTRTGRSARLAEHTDKPTLTLHPADASTLDIDNGSLVRVRSANGEVIAEAEISVSVRRGEVFMPIHWNRQFASSANVSQLYAAVVDPISGQPESKQCAVQLTPAQFATRMQVFTRERLEIKPEFWTQTTTEFGLQYQLAFAEQPQDMLFWCQQAASLKGCWYSYHRDTISTILCLLEGQLMFAAFFGTSQPKVPKAWLTALFSKALCDESEIKSLLQAQPDTEFLQGKLICSCFKVREIPIQQAIAEGTTTVNGLGEKLKCGTQCGSCRSELAELIHNQKTPHPAALHNNPLGVE